MAHRLFRSRRGLYAVALLVTLLFVSLSSCSHKLGWGLVLWTAPEGPLPAGSVVPVYIKSNINHVYVVGSLDGSKKLELPLWQLDLYPSRGRARAAAAQFAPLAPLYLVATRDGLPVHVSPINNSTRVYRLREGQSMKILATAKGEEVRTGDNVLQGDWYYVLTEDGTRGYVFSNTLRLFDETKESGAATLIASTPTSSIKIDNFFSHSWRPLYFQEMMDSGRPDLDLFQARYGIFADAVHRQIRLELPEASEVFTYTSITDEGGSWLFEGSPLRIKFEGERLLLADWTGLPFATAAATSAGPASPAATATTGAAQTSASQALDAQTAPGANGRAEFLVLASDIRDVIRTEELRRQRLLDTFVATGSEWSLLVPPAPPAPGGSSPAPASPASPEAAPSQPALPATPPSALAQVSASRLSVSGNGRFGWSHIELVPAGYVPASLPPGDAAQGEIAFRLYLAKPLEADWQGVLSLRFDGAQAAAWIDFLYRIDADGLLLAPVAESANLEASQASPLVPLRFSPAKAR
jgi:hypothetical protein